MMTLMTWKRRRSRRVAEARMRIGKTQFSSLHHPVWRLAYILNQHFDDGCGKDLLVETQMKPTLTSFREALSSFVTKSSPSQSSQSTWSGDAHNYFEKIFSLRSRFLELVFVCYKKTHSFLLAWPWPCWRQTRCWGEEWPSPSATGSPCSPWSSPSPLLPVGFHQFRTNSQVMDIMHCRSVTKNLTPYGFIFFGWGLDGQITEIHSFPTMYIIGGGKWGRNGSKQWFSPKKWSKNSFFE